MSQVSKILIFLMTLNLVARGQQQLSNAVPSAPGVASISNNAGYDVNLSTGTAVISLPVYTINTGAIQIPFTLSYIATGIKVNDRAGNVGLGWSLSTVGSINRINIKGPDKNFVNIARSDFFSQLSLIEQRYGILPQYSVPISAIDTSSAYKSLLSASNRNKQADIYAFNILGYSGKFMIESNGKVVLIPKQAIQITYNDADSSIVLTTPEGIRCFFNAYDIGEVSYKTTVKDWSVEESDVVLDSLEILEVPETITKSCITTWYPTKLVALNAVDSVMLAYERGTAVADENKRYGVTLNMTAIEVYTPNKNVRHGLLI